MKNAATSYQKTLITYATGSKVMAYLSYKADADANQDLTFDQFCTAFDRQMIIHEQNRPINPVSCKKEACIWN